MLVLSLASVLVLVAALLASLSAVAVARQRAAGIADLAALAGAARALDGQAAACARAEQVALLGGGRLVECSLDGARVEVRAEVRPPGGLGALGAAAARASAGPVDGLATAAVTGVSRDRSPGLRTASCGPSPRRNSAGFLSLQVVTGPPDPGALRHAAVLHLPAGPRARPRARRAAG